MITDIVITIEGIEFDATAYHSVCPETGVVDSVYGLYISDKKHACLSALLDIKAFHDNIRDTVQECFDEDCEKARKRKLNGEDI